MAMSQQHKNLLTRNRLRLVREVTLGQEFFAILQSNYTLTVSMVEEIESVRTTQGKVGKLLDILPKRGSGAFPTFIDALIETHQDQLVALLDASQTPSSTSNVRVIAQPNDSGAGGGQLTPSATSSSIDQPSASNQPQQTSDEPLSKGQINVQQPSHENASSKTQSVNISGRSEVDEITQCVKESQNHSFIYQLYSPVDGAQPGKTESLRNGRCIVFRNKGMKKYGYVPNFDDVNLNEAFKMFGIKVESTFPLTSPEDISDCLRGQTEIDASAFFLFVFAPGSGDVILTDNGKSVSTFEIVDIVKKSVALKGKPKVLIFHLCDSGPTDSMDSVAESGYTAPSLELSALSLSTADNLAVLKVATPQSDELKTHWLVSSLIFLMTKYSKIHALDKILDFVKRILDNEGYSVKLNSSLNISSHVRSTAEQIALCGHQRKDGDEAKRFMRQSDRRGQVLEDVATVTVSEAGEDTCQLPLLCLNGIVLVPGQTLPLHLFQSSQALMVRRVADNNEVFGVITERFASPTEGHVRSNIGTTVEIESFEEDSISSSVKVKGIGCKRFQVISSQRQIDGSVLGTVRILAERELPPLLENIMLASQRRQIHQPHCDDATGIKTVKRRKIDRLSAAVFTHWPSWVYKQYDSRSVLTNIQKELAACNSTLNLASRSKEPVEYSFWLLANLPIDDKMKLSLLAINSTIQRLRCELGILKSCAVMCCKDCGLFIADKKDVFSMAKDGPLGMYVNPGGYIHEMITVYRADGLKNIGAPSSENTWFEGFAWTVVQCRNCTAHIGWKFTAQRRSLCLDKFWGVCRSAVLPGIRQDLPLEADLSPLKI